MHKCAVLSSYADSALTFSNFGPVVKATKGICESAPAENMFLALGIPVWLCECLFIGEEMVLASLYSVFVKGNSQRLI